MVRKCSMKNIKFSRILLTLFLSGLVLPPLIIGIDLTPVTSPVFPAALIIPLWEQTALFIAAFIIKPLYMTVALVIAFLLRKHSDTDLTALRRGMILFFMGEMACALNFLLFQDNSPLMEYFHIYGMVSAFALFAYTVMDAFDKRLMQFSDVGKRCVLLPQCGSCYKLSDMKCTMRTIYLYLIAALCAVAMMPLCAPVATRFFRGTIFGEQVMFGHPLSGQMIEVRFFPLVAIFFLLISLGVLLFRKEDGFDAAKILVALGLGPLAFSLMRFICYWGYSEHPLWADIWEELTEFMFVVIILRIVLLIRSRSCQRDSTLPNVSELPEVL